MYLGIPPVLHLHLMQPYSHAVKTISHQCVVCVGHLELVVAPECSVHHIIRFGVPDANSIRLVRVYDPIMHNIPSDVCVEQVPRSLATSSHNHLSLSLPRFSIEVSRGIFCDVWMYRKMWVLFPTLFVTGY